MNSREMLELAALASCHGPLLLEPPTEISQAMLEQYWSASKCRLDRWGRTLKNATHSAKGPRARAALPSTYLYSVIEEILASEVLTRVWTAVLAGHDRLLGRQETECIATSVLSGHLEARHRALKLLVEGPGISAHEAVQLNRVRRRAECWSDLLVGHIAAVAPVADFAVQPERAREFAADRNQERHVPADVSWKLLTAALRAAFRQGITSFAPNADTNVLIAGSILACFPSERFDSTGLLASARMLRLQRATADIELRIEELFAEDAGHVRRDFRIRPRTAHPPEPGHFTD
jgi:hypothetical protein